ncbi:uncharacterized protein LOC141630674 [Silene latifolia]|uniref:uncharacterized protein LOC141630674 n=1 Tax=Silene latifolia TaxID=37657 RepID=UPI003D785776
MTVDPLESLVQDGSEEEDDECIDTMETSAAWTTFRNELATQMYNAWWSSAEDQALVSAMQDLLDLGGWKADNGQFKNGAYSKIATLLEEKLPGCGKRDKPHIESRVKTLRKQFDAITDMLSPQASGFSWNDEQKFVTCEQSVWEAWLKIILSYTHKNAAGLRNRPFPLYDELAKIWGKDSVNGNEGGSVQDALEEMENEARGEQEEIEEEKIHISNTSGMSSTEVEASPSSAPINKKTKKARTETIEAFREFSGHLNKMTNVMETAGEHIRRLANCFKHESETADRRMQVILEVMKIEGLTRAEVILASKKIATDPLDVDFFFSLPDDYRSAYVHGLLIPERSN